MGGGRGRGRETPLPDLGLGRTSVTPPLRVFGSDGVAFPGHCANRRSCDSQEHPQK